MTGQGAQGETAATRQRGRDFAIVAALVAALALVGQATILAMAPEATGARKTVMRLDAGSIGKRELAYAPHDLVADQSLRTFKPGPAWSPEPATPVAMAAIPVSAIPLAAAPLAPAVVVVASPVAVLLKPAPRVRLVAAPRPPVRPAAFAQAPAPRAFAAAPEGPATIAGFQLPRFVPTGANILDRIGAVGSSLGKLIRVSSR